MDVPGSPNIVKQLAAELHSSSSTGDLAKVTRILGGLSDVNTPDSQGWTALMFAARNGHEKIAQLLLDKG